MLVAPTPTWGHFEVGCCRIRSVQGRLLPIKMGVHRECNRSRSKDTETGLSLGPVVTSASNSSEFGYPSVRGDLSTDEDDELRRALFHAVECSPSAWRYRWSGVVPRISAA